MYRKSGLGGDEVREDDTDFEAFANELKQAFLGRARSLDS